ncbi:class I SAM-dependent methyltransferase [Candidatus Igneacidithiobacillus taiwanensis]|uniref:class I SAM-dependent methyltransferase n=1 Tax=Candidatus Igneacidithiobacillus taiwanensis TaxID=1945924 RepID=UPI00289B9B78|nr:class I SAM-dependent methyltransferase [Candidatus Igneacidithiobacillus taiwanensis]
MQSIRNYDFDSHLNRRQLFSRTTLRLLSSADIEICTIRFDALLKGGVAQPHVDIYFYLSELDRLIPALALPIEYNSQRIIWPEVFADWPATLLDDVSRYVMDLWRANQMSGQIIFTESARMIFGDAIERRLSEFPIPGLQNYWTTAQMLSRYQWVTEQIESGRVLEVAAGSGFGAAWLLDRREGISTYVGVDLDDTAIRLAKHINTSLTKFHLGPIEELPDGDFDWILSLETIEHTADPEEFLLTLKQRLAPA